MKTLKVGHSYEMTEDMPHYFDLQKGDVIFIKKARGECFCNQDFEDGKCQGHYAVDIARVDGSWSIDKGNFCGHIPMCKDITDTEKKKVEGVVEEVVPFVKRRMIIMEEKHN